MADTVTDLDAAITAEGNAVTALSGTVSAIITTLNAAVAKINAAGNGPDLTTEVTAINSIASSLATFKQNLDTAEAAAKPVAGA